MKGCVGCLVLIRRILGDITENELQKRTPMAESLKGFCTEMNERL